MSGKLLAGVIAGVVAIASVGHGAVITKYDFTSSNTVASSVDPNATASPLTFGTSVNAPITTKKNREKWERVQSELALLQNINTRPEVPAR